MNSSAKHTVLLVDGNTETSAMYAHGLLAAGFVVTTAASATAALSAINYELPDVVVVDWQMPEMQGDELLMLLAGNTESRDLPVLFLSDIPKDDLHVTEAIVPGQAVGWLVKSRTTAQQLANQLLSLLDGHAVEPVPRADGNCASDSDFVRN